MSDLKPTTPITAHLDKLLSPQGGAGGGVGDNVGVPISSSSRADSPPNDSASSDPSAALDNLFAAKFSFQFDNLQTILRYILGEMRVQKKTSLDVATLKDRIAQIVPIADNITSVTMQTNLCKKHNTHVSGTLARLEDRMTKEGVLVNRRLAALEVQTEKIGVSVNEQQGRISQAMSKQPSQVELETGLGSSVSMSNLGIGLGSLAGSSHSSSLGSLHGGIGGGGVSVGAAPPGGDIDGMSGHISKFLATQGAALATLTDKVKQLEDNEFSVKKEAANVEVKLNYLQNENKRLQEKMAALEDEIETLKKAPPPPPTATGQLPLPDRLTGAVVDSNESVEFAVNLEAGRSPATQPAIAPTDGTVAPSPVSVIASELSALESTLSSKISDLKKDLDDRWTVEKEIARESRRALMEAVTQAGDSALDAKNALQRTTQIVQELEGKMATGGFTAAASSGDRPNTSSKNARPSSDAAAAALLSAGDPTAVGGHGRRPSIGFAGLESLGAEVNHSRTPTPADPTGMAFAGAANTNNNTVANKHARQSSTSGAAPPVGPSGSAAAAAASKALKVSQLDFDRVKAMAELALRRTVQHGDALALVEGSSFRKDPSHGVVSRLDLDKMKAGMGNMSSRILYLEDRLETINALTLATRNQTTALATAVDENPTFKAIQLRLFENEVLFNELGDKVKLLAHMLAKGGPPVPSNGGGGGGYMSNPLPDGVKSPGLATRGGTIGGISVAPQPRILTNPRSLVSTLAAEEKAAAEAEAKQPEPTSGTAPPVNIVHADDGEHHTYTDVLDDRSASIAMVLRDGSSHIGTKSNAQVEKDLRTLGKMDEKLTSIENLDMKLAMIHQLESKVESLLDLDLKERLTFMERRFNTELTFLRSHVNTKVDSSSLKVLLDKIDLEGQLGHLAASGGAAGVAQVMTQPMASSSTANTSPTRRPAAAADTLPTSPRPDLGEGMMARASGRETRGRAAGEVDRAARDRKQRLAHLLSLLDKKADHAAIRSVEEFVRSIDRHLRSLIQQHSLQLKQLESQGLIQPIQRMAKKKGQNNGGTLTQVKAYDDEAKVDAGGASSGGGVGGVSNVNHDPLYDDTHDEEWDDHEIEYAVAHADEIGIGARRQAITNMISNSSQKNDPSSHGDHDSNRLGFHLSNTPAHIAQLQRRCEDLQMQIASLHGQLASKQDRIGPMGHIESARGSQVFESNAAAADDRPTSSKQAPNDVNLRRASNHSRSSATSGVGVVHPTLLVSLDGMTLNPNLSLLDHPHVSRLLTRTETLERDLSHAQSLIMYQSKQLRNHREWIAKHSRELNALREFVKFAQANQQANLQAIGTNTNDTTMNIRDSQSMTLAGATASAYPSTAVYQLLRQIEQDIISLRRTLKQKLDFADLGISNPHDSSQAIPISSGNYPHPSLEDLRRLIFYLTPQLNVGGGVGLTGSPSTAVFAQSNAGGVADTNRLSIFAAKGHHVPPIGADGIPHTHGPGGPETWKCLACDRTLATLTTVAGGKVSRHANLTSSLSSVAPAGGLVGSNTRKLIAQTNVGALIQSHRGGKYAPTGMASEHQPSAVGALHPRPPNSATAGHATQPYTPRAAAARLAAATATATSVATAAAPVNMVGTPRLTVGDDPAMSEQDRVAREAKLARRAERKAAKAEAKAAATAAASASAASSPTSAAASASSATVDYAAETGHVTAALSAPAAAPTEPAVSMESPPRNQPEGNNTMNASTEAQG